MKRTSFAVLFAIFFLAYAECALAQGTYTAATCNRSDVNAVINGPTHVAVNGDIIQIPAGSCIWTSNVTTPAGIGITIQGSGTPNSTPATFGPSASCTATNIVENAGSHIFWFSPNAGASLSRISCIKLTSTNSAATSAAFVMAGTCNSSTCPNIRIDNITVDPSLYSTSLQGDSSTKVVANNVFGVIDHVSMSAPQTAPGEEFLTFNNTAWQGVGDFGDNSYAARDSMGTAQTLYMENNAFGAGAVLTENEGQSTTNGGGRVAVRFNQCNGCITMGSWHGTESNGRPRSGRQAEVYNNTMACSVGGCQVSGPRGGVGIFFGNSLSSIGGWFNSYIGIVTYRITQTGLSSLWQPCPGPWDSSGASICLDQAGRSGGTYLSGTSGPNSGPTPTGWANEVIDPIYEWNDTGQAPSFSNVTSDWAGVAANRDYYTDNSNGASKVQTSATSPFNGTSGVGFGTLARRPTTCTPGPSGAPGVGYFATDSGPAWNNGTVGGQLFACSSSSSPTWQQGGTSCVAAGSNFWCLYYTPYTYPHPLVTGTSTGSALVSAPKSLQAVVQ